jgi:hypothetical protein
MLIDNERLIEEGHQYRLRDGLNLNEHFVVLPKFVFKALSSWYPCNLTIERAVIKRKASHADHSSLFKLVREDTVFQLELDPKLVYFEKISSEGERPFAKCIQNQKIDKTYLTKVLKTD